MQLLDKITLKNGGELNGVIDFSSTKHLIVIDLTNNTSPSLTHDLIEWRLFHPHLRFTVYSSMLGLKHPTPVLINKRDIANSSLANPVQRIKKTERLTLPN